MTRAEVGRRFGTPFSPDATARAIEMGMLIPDGKEGTAYLVPSPSLLDAGAELIAAGVPLDVVLDLAAAVRDDMSRVARRFTSLLLDHIADTDDEKHLTAPLSPDVAKRVVRLRPYAQRTVDALLLLAMQRETDRLLDQLAHSTDLTEDQ